MAYHGPHDDFVVRAVRYMNEARERLHVPARVRFELRRKAWHVLGAVAAVPVLLVLPIPWAIGIALLGIVLILSAYSVERRRSLVASPLAETLENTVGRALKETRRHDEGFPWASILYGVSLIIIAFGTQELGVPLAYAFAAFGILGMGDAASALIGIAYGRTRLPWNRRKSLEGTVGGIVVGYFTAVLLASVAYAWTGEVLPLTLFGVCAVGAVVGMLLESLPRVQDNFVIPLGAWFSMVGLAAALHLL